MPNLKLKYQVYSLHRKGNNKFKGNLCMCFSGNMNLLYYRNLIILFGKYLFDIGSEVWLNLFWDYINRKQFAVIFTFSVSLYPLLETA